MTLVQLSYVVAVDTYRHFSSAADSCFVTQPTLSMQIHKLEEELGILIFDRSKHPIEPTSIGEKIIVQARIIPTVAPYLIPRFLKSFSKKYPKVELLIDEIQTNVILDKIDKNLIDVGILATPLEKDQLIEIPLYYESLMGYVHESHPLSNKKQLDSDELEINDILLLDEGNCFREQALMMCQKKKKSIRKKSTRFESGNLETLRKLVNQ